MFWYPNRPLLMSRDYLFEISKQDIEQGNKSPWSGELKMNGDRLELQYINGQFKFMNRYGQELKYKAPERVLSNLRALKLKGDCQLDGELLHNHTKSVKDCIILYDIYVFNDSQQRGTLQERRKLLHEICQEESENLQISSVYRNQNWPVLFSEIIQREEIEGFVFKHDNGKIIWQLNKSPDVPWQVKVRRRAANYLF